jgi:phytoene synthase
VNPLKLFKKSSFAPAFWLLTASRRRALAAVYAFARAVDDAVDVPNGTPPREALDRWRALLSEPYVPEGRAVPPEWPALEETLKGFPIDRRHLLDLIDGVARDIGGFRAETFEDFRAYCHGVASTVGLACLPIFGLDEDGHRAFAESLGWAVQAVNVLRDVRPDALDGRVYLPREDLRRFGVSEDDLKSPALSPAVLRLLRFEAGRAREFFRQARQALPPLSRRAARPAVAMGALYERLLDKMERGDFLWGRPRPSLSLWEKARILLWGE